MNLLGAFVNAFKVPDLRRKILFTLLIIAVYRLGSHVPTPGIDVEAAQRFAAGAQGGVFQFINLFSGGALTQMAVFALGIMPYITSSIIMQLLTVVIPKLEAWSKEGEQGHKKITQWTRYLTVLLALLQSTGLAFLFHRGQFGQTGVQTQVDLIPVFTPARVALIVLMEQGQRRIPVQYAKRVVGRRMYGGSSTYIPLKVNQSGIIPIIFASSVLYIPTLLQNVIQNESIQNFIDNNLVNP